MEVIRYFKTIDEISEIFSDISSYSSSNYSYSCSSTSSYEEDKPKPNPKKLKDFLTEDDFTID